MKQKENLQIKMNKLNPLYDMLKDYDQIFKVNDLYSLPDIDLNSVWSNQAHFIKDFIKYAPANFIFKSIQKKGTLLKINK
jgi:hypothetical protein